MCFNVKTFDFKSKIFGFNLNSSVFNKKWFFVDMIKVEIYE